LFQVSNFWFRVVPVAETFYLDSTLRGG